MERLRQLIHEIHCRSLWQVLGIYLVASWAVLQVVDTLVGTLGLPEWFPPLALALLLVGLPIVLATAFVQEGGPGRDTGDEEVAGAPADAPAPTGASGLFTWRNAFGGGVLAFALLGFVGTGWILFGGGLRTSEAPAPFEQSVAVMPCTDSSAPGVPTPLTQGFAEGIINALAKLPNLKVSGLTSVIELLAQNADIDAIAERLDVTTVLECSLQQVGEMVRVRPQLVEAATSAVLWSAEINGPATDLFEMQDAVARAVADELQVVFAGGEETPLVAQGTTVPEAHEAYLLGRYFWNQRTGESLQRAITEFQRAIMLDAEYAEAYSGLADSYLVLPRYAPVPDSRVVYQTALEVALDAVARAPNLGMARTSLAFAYTFLAEWDNAEREFQQAMELSPGYATGLQWYGNFLRMTGRAEQAVVVARRSVEADPVSQVVNSDFGWALLAAERVEEGVEQMQRTRALDRTWLTGSNGLVWAQLAAGAYSEALDAQLTWARLSGADSVTARRFVEAVDRYRETGESQSLSFPADYPVGGGGSEPLWYTATGQRGRALEALESLPHPTLAILHQRGVPGTIDLLGDDPRYQALLEEAGITW